MQKGGSNMSNLPKDPIILLSFTNTQLRDNYSNLEEFCKAYIVDENDIINTLHTIDYEYDKSVNQFV
jgi:hypothetical protein